MNGNEGLSRIARVISGIGWIWGILLALGAVSNLASNRQDVAIIFFIFGVIGLGSAKALAWIIRGFATPRR